MARKKTGKRGSAIIVLMVVAAIAGSPGTASADPGKKKSHAIDASVYVAPAALPVLGTDLYLDASWADASWAEE
jgi:hypothetical protein